MNKKHTKFFAIAFLAILSILSIVFAPDFSDAVEYCDTENMICADVPNAISMNLPANTNVADVESLTIKNTSSTTSIKISNISVTALNSYSFQTYSTDFGQLEPDSKQVALGLDLGASIADVASEGGYNLDMVIARGNTFTIKLKGKSTIVTNYPEGISDDEIGKLVISIDATTESPKTSGCFYTELEKWDYSKDDATKKITLNKLKETSTDKTIIVCDSFIVNGETYSVQIANQDSSNDDYFLRPDNNAEVISIIFGSNVDSSLVTDMRRFFCDFDSLETIILPNNFGANATTMEYMFGENPNLKTLDLSTLNTSNVTNMTNMFSGSSALETIYVADLWDTSKVTTYSNIFNGTNALVGGTGTKWDSSYASERIYARVDEAEYNKDGTYVTGHKGLFTYKCTPKALQLNDGTLYFICDNSSYTTGSTISHDGSTKTINAVYSVPSAPEQTSDIPWYGNNLITVVDFSQNFRNFHPTSLDYYFSEMSYIVQFNNAQYMDVSKVTSMNSTFASMSTQVPSISLDLSSWNTESLQGLNYAFGSFGAYDGVTEKTITLNVTGWDVTHVEHLQGFDCIGASSDSTVTILGLSSWDTSNVKSMGDLFFGAGGSAASLDIGDISNWDTSSVTNMDNMFRNLGRMETLDLSNWDTSNVTTMDAMFEDARIKYLDLTNFTTGKITNMRYMFSGASSLKTIYVGADWVISEDCNSKSMFNGNASLVGGAGSAYDTYSIQDKAFAHIDQGTSNPGYFTDSLARSGDTAKAVLTNDGTLNFIYGSTAYTASDTYNSLPITAVYNVPKNATSAADIPWKDDAASIIAIDFGSTFATYQPTSTAYWFYQQYNVETIDNLDNIDTSQVTNMSHMFDQTGDSTSVTAFQSFNNFQVWDTSNVKDMSYMFYRFANQATKDFESYFWISVSYWNTSNVTNVSHMFDGAGGAGTNGMEVEISVQDWDVKNVTDMSYMFANICSGTESTTDLSCGISGIYNWNIQQVTDMSHMFDGAGKYASEWVIDDISKWNVASVKNMEGMFSNVGTKHLDLSIDLSEWNTTSVTNMSSMFSGSGVKTVYVGDNWKTTAVTNSTNMFLDATNIIGGAGTVYNSSIVDKQYARIDGVGGNAGYLTSSNNRPKYAKAVMSVDGEVDFVYDTAIYYPAGRTYTSNAYGDFEVEATIILGDNPYISFIAGGWGAVTVSYLINDAYYVNFDASFKQLNLTDIYSNANTFINELNTKAFCNDDLVEITNLKNINLTGVTSLAKFFYEVSVDELDFTDFNTSNIKSMESMFEGATIRSALDISSLNMANVTTFEGMFEESTINGNITFPKESFGANVEIMSDMFNGITMQGDLDISKIDTSSAEDLARMFAEMQFSGTIKFPETFGQAANSMLAMFYNSDTIVSLDLTSFEFDEIDAYYMFNDMDNLEKIYVSLARIDWSGRLTDSNNMFTDSPKLPGYSADNSNDETYAHAGTINGVLGYFVSTETYTDTTTCTGTCTVKALILSNYELVFVYDNQTYTENSSTFLTARGENTVIGVGSPGNIGYYDSYITSVYITDSFASYQPTSTAYWFGNLTNAQYIDGLEKLDTSQVTTMAQMFSGASSLTELDLSSFDVSKVTTVSYMFEGMTNIEHIYVASGTDWEKDANITSSSSMFDSDTKLQYYDMPFTEDKTNSPAVVRAAIGLKRATTKYRDDSWGLFTDICEKTNSCATSANNLTFAQAFKISGKEMVTVTNNGHTYYYYKMQDLNADICSLVKTPTSTNADDTESELLVDIRNNRPYTVSKLLDGNCWMTRDLAIDGGTTLNSTTSDIADETKKVTIEEFSSSTSGPVVHSGTFDDDAYYSMTNQDYLGNDLDNYSRGWYYSSTAAFAQTEWTSSSNHTGEDKTDSICPAGWDLPSSTKASTTHPTPSLYNLISTYYDGTALRSTPLNISNAGFSSGLATSITRDEGTRYITSTLVEKGYDAVLATDGVIATAVDNTDAVEGAQSSSIGAHVSVRCVVAATGWSWDNPLLTTSLLNAAIPNTTSASLTTSSSASDPTLLGLQNIEGMEGSTSEDDEEEDAEDESTDPLGVIAETTRKLSTNVIIIPITAILFLFIILLIIKVKKRRDEQYVELL